MNAQLIGYDGLTFPDNDPVAPWTRYGTFDAQRWLADGLFCQFLALGVWAPGPYGQNDGYKRTIGEFAGASGFFISWREFNTAPRSDIGGLPAGLSTNDGISATVFGFSITRDQVRLVRDNPISLVLYVDIAPDVFHTYYLALHNDLSYSWYIDGVVVNSGQFPDPFPTATARISWWAEYYNDEQTAKWDYVRYGVIPANHSGDFNNNGAVDESDVYFFVDCLLGPGYDAAGPGCKWADMNADGKADGADVQQFIAAMVSG